MNKQTKLYKASYSKKSMFMFYSNNDTEALKKAGLYQKRFGTLISLSLVEDCSYSVIKNIV